MYVFRYLLVSGPWPSGQGVPLHSPHNGLPPPHSPDPSELPGFDCIVEIEEVEVYDTLFHSRDDYDDFAFAYVDEFDELQFVH